MAVPALNEAYRFRGLSIAGNREVLVKCLEGAVAGQD